MTPLWLLYVQLFWSFFKTGLFSIGGGYAMIPLIEKNMVEFGWMTTAEIADMVAISQMTPGPFAINCATFVGQRMAGFGGACVATLGVTLPSVIIVLIIARFFVSFQKKPVVRGVLYGMRPAVVGLIASVALGVAGESLYRAGTTAANIDIAAVVIAVIAFVCMRRFKVNPILLIVLSAVAGVVVYGFL